MNEQIKPRRRFLFQAGTLSLVAVSVVSGVSVLGGCFKKDEPEADDNSARNAIQSAQEAADPCTDLSGLSAAEIDVRDDFGYEDRSDDGTELCQTCSFWRPSPRGDFCGGCTLMKGPIHPLGTCGSWEEITQT